MSFTVIWKSTEDITNKVISYNREHSLCSSVGTLTVEVVGYDSYTTWDEIVIKENGTKQATYNLSTIVKNGNGTTTLTGENGAKRSGDYFVPTYYNPGWVSNAKYWIEKFLTEAGISYSFNVAGNGATIDAGTAFGRDTVYNIIIPFLQHSGWYITYDEDNDATIGTLDKNLSNYVDTFTRDEIISISLRKNDKMSRNKAIVWGGNDFLREQVISASVYERQDWQISSKDRRPIIVSNSAIKNYSTAYGIAHKLVNEFSSLTKVKELQVIGFHDVREGDVVFVKSDIYTGTGMITSLTSTASKAGEIMTLVLDERCPRIFAYFAWDGYVYVGTWGAGIYRKPLEVNSWSSYNSGLDNLQIKDLYIQNGVFVCVANDGYAYYRYITDSSWRKIYHGTLTDTYDTEYEEENIEAVACTIDDDNNIIIGYNLIGAYDISWILHYKPLVGIYRTEQVIADDTNDKIEIYDLDNTGERTIIGVAGGINVSGEGMIVRNWNKYRLDHLDSTGYYSDCTEIMDANYDEIVIPNIRGVHKKYVYNAVYGVDYHCVLQKVVLATGEVVSSVDMYSDGYGLVLGTNILTYTPHILSENLMIIEGSYTNYFYAVNFSTTTATFWRYSDKQQYSYTAVATSDGCFYCLYNTTDPLDFSYYGWGDGMDPEKWFVEVNGTEVTQLISEETDWQLDYSDYSYETPYGTYPATDYEHRDQRMLGIFEVAGGGVEIPCVEVLGCQAYQEQYGPEYNEGYDSFWGNWGVIGFKSFDADGTQSGISEIFETKKELCYIMQSNLTHKAWKNIYSYSKMYFDSISDFNGSGGVITHFQMFTQAAGCLPGEWDYKDYMYLWSYWYENEFLTGDKDWQDYFISFHNGASIIEVRDYETSPSVALLGQGAGGAWYWGSLSGVSSFYSITGGNTGTPANTLTLSTKSCDITGNYIGTYYDGGYRLGIIDSSMTRHEITTLAGIGESRAELLGQNVYTAERVLYVSSGAQTSVLPDTAGSVLRDNYLLGDIIPSGYAGFTTVLSGILGSPHIELSRTAPTIVHMESSGSIPASMWSSYTNTSGSFTPIATANRRIVNDARVYMEFNENVPASGGFRVGIASPSGFLKTMPDLSTEFTPAFSGIMVSGEVLKLETTNYDTPPFFFLVTGSGSGQKFYQRNPSSSSFFEHSTGLPTISGEITIIRADDEM